ncbi:MFS transporter [Streptomyces sp. NPDC006333]|uniref:MFS transporter n=1 Tax=unclassified Streptomyces TaxID=2593676 RepID=UPI0033A7442F
MLVEVTYRVAAERVAAFKGAMSSLAVSRRRTGASHWSLYRDAEDEGSWVEVFEVPSWEEHLRQHEGRITGYDADLIQQARELSEQAPAVRHLVPPPV